MSNIGNKDDQKSKKYRYKVKWNKHKEYVDTTELQRRIELEHLTYSVFRDDLVNDHLLNDDQNVGLMDHLRGTDIERGGKNYSNISEDELSEVRTEKSRDFAF